MGDQGAKKANYRANKDTRAINGGEVMNVWLVVAGETHILQLGNDYMVDGNTVTFSEKWCDQMRIWKEEQKAVEIRMAYTSNSTVSWDINIA